MTYTRKKITTIFMLFFLLLYPILCLPIISYAEDPPETTSTGGSATGYSGPDLYGQNIEISAAAKDSGNAAAKELEQVLTDSSFGLLTIVTYIGAVVFVFGFGKMVLSFRDDSPGEKAQSVSIMLAGIFLIVIQTILKNIMSGMDYQIGFK